MKNLTLVSTNYNQKDTYSVSDTVEYSCDEGFKLKGNKTVTCNYKGQWSTPPEVFTEAQKQIKTSPSCTASTSHSTDDNVSHSSM